MNSSVIERPTSSHFENQQSILSDQRNPDFPEQKTTPSNTDSKYYSNNNESLASIKNNNQPLPRNYTPGFDNSNMYPQNGYDVDRARFNPNTETSYLHKKTNQSNSTSASQTQYPNPNFSSFSNNLGASVNQNYPQSTNETPAPYFQSTNQDYSQKDGHSNYTHFKWANDEIYPLDRIDITNFQSSIDLSASISDLLNNYTIPENLSSVPISSLINDDTTTPILNQTTSRNSNSSTIQSNIYPILNPTPANFGVIGSPLSNGVFTTFRTFQQIGPHTTYSSNNPPNLNFINSSISSHGAQSNTLPPFNSFGNSNFVSQPRPPLSSLLNNQIQNQSSCSTFVPFEKLKFQDFPFHKIYKTLGKPQLINVSINKNKTIEWGFFPNEDLKLIEPINDIESDYAVYIYATPISKANMCYSNDSFLAPVFISSNFDIFVNSNLVPKPTKKLKVFEVPIEITPYLSTNPAIYNTVKISYNFLNASIL
ncbi:hypothetical protein BB560_003918 [Smittium megazygosporum]|uniref:PINIT domain-containing protein n=1 Tax=Smittium megazygosporum TaxID=133381 RepID=A0A2T9ZAN2_9FUNG|nr:hypothetical protein BB560_003918 [Smittium megazygosporum]